MKNKVTKFVLAALFAALTFIMTWIAIPTPTVGNVNLGDCMVLFGAYILGAYGVLSGAVGAALCDLASGYVIYAPGTLLIKALMAAAVLLFRKRAVKSGKLLPFALSGALAEILMIAGYFIYESLVLGYGLGAAANIPFNAIQGTISLVAASVLFTATKNLKAVKSIIEK